MTIISLFDEYRGYLAHERRMTRETIYCYLSDLRRLANDCPSEIHDIQLVDLRNHVQNLSKSGLHTNTIRRKIHAFRTFWHWLVLADYTKENLPAKLRNLKRVDKEPVWMTVEDILKFANTPAVNNQCALAWNLLASLGLRRGELLKLHWADVQDETIIIRESKNHRDRVLFISPKTKELLQAQRVEHPEATSVFVGWTFRHLRTAFAKHLVVCGLDGRGITPHTLRHSFATHLMRQGVHIATLKELLGHKDIKTTTMYLHHDKDTLKQAIELHVLNQ